MSHAYSKDDNRCEDSTVGARGSCKPSCVTIVCARSVDNVCEDGNCAASPAGAHSGRLRQQLLPLLLLLRPLYAVAGHAMPMIQLAAAGVYKSLD
jgi:hypothetical protein